MDNPALERTAGRHGPCDSKNDRTPGSAVQWLDIIRYRVLMEGRLIQLLGDDRTSAGRTFWTCFEPLRGLFDSCAWIVHWQPWFGDPPGFRDSKGLSEPDFIDARIDARLIPNHRVAASLWRKGSLSRWARHFCEEHVCLWAPRSRDPVPVWIEYEALTGENETFIEQHAAIRLEYSDSCCWEIFALDRDVLAAVEFRARHREDIKCLKTTSQNRRWGFSQVGWDTWPY